MNIKYLILIIFMAGIYLLSIATPTVSAQSEVSASVSPAVSGQPIFGPAEPLESTETTEVNLIQTSVGPSPTPETIAGQEATTEPQPSQSPDPTPSASPAVPSSSTPAPVFEVPSPSPYTPPQTNTGFFSWKGFFNLDSFFDKFWGTRFQSSLDGSQEVGEYGDPDGAGKVMLETYPSGNKICVVLKTTGLDQLIGVAIHWGPFGVEDESVVNLPMIIEGGVGSGCAVVDSELLKDIRKNPFNYYVNVSTSAYLDGAIRGQLSRQ